MTKKDYVAIAAALRAARANAMHYRLAAARRDDLDTVARCEGERDGIDAAAETFATIAARDNPRFDRARFLAACGVQS